MKRSILLVFYFFSFFTCFAQHEKVKKVTVQNAVLQAYIAANHGQLGFIEFSRAGNLADIKVSPDTSITAGKNIPYENSYQLNYLGHQYLLEKKFGLFPHQALSALLDSLIPKKCEYAWFDGVISERSVTIKITSYCSKGRNQVFAKVPNEAYYPGGSKALTNYINTELSKNGDLKMPPLTDSIMLFKLVVKRDSLVHEVRSMDSSGSLIKSTIMTVLKGLKNWHPAIQGGRPVNAYVEVFVRFRKDGTIEADYRH